MFVSTSKPWKTKQKRKKGRRKKKKTRKRRRGSAREGRRDLRCLSSNSPPANAPSWCSCISQLVVILGRVAKLAMKGFMAHACVQKPHWLNWLHNYGPNLVVSLESWSGLKHELVGSSIPIGVLAPSARCLRLLDIVTGLHRPRG